MRRTKTNVYKVNNRKNKANEGGKVKNGQVLVEKSTFMVSTHTDDLHHVQTTAETTMTANTTTMTATAAAENGLSTPTRGPRKNPKEVVEVGGGSDDENGDGAANRKSYAEVATTMTTTTMVDTTTAQGGIPVKPTHAVANAKISPIRKGQGRGKETKRSPNRLPGQGDTPDAKKMASTTEQTPIKLFDKEPVQLQKIVGMGMAVTTVVQRLRKCYYNPFFAEDGTFHGSFGFVFWLESLAVQMEKTDPKVAFLLRNISPPEPLAVDDDKNATLFRVLCKKGRFSAGEHIQSAMKHKDKQNGVAFLWHLIEHFGTPDSLDWALVQIALDIDDETSKKELPCWDGEWTTFSKWQAPIATRLTAPLFRPLLEQESSIQEHKRLLAGQWAFWTILRATFRTEKAKAFLAPYTYRSGYTLYQDLVVQHKFELLESPAVKEKPVIEITPEEEKWLMEEDDVTVAAGKDDVATVTSSLLPRRLYNHRFKFTVTGTGHDQRSKGFAAVVEALNQMMQDIKGVTNSQPVIRPWRLANTDSPTITEPRGIPRSEAGLAPYLFDRFWDRVSGNYYAEIFLGFDGKAPAELAALTRTEGATVDQLPYYLTDRAIQDDSVECAGRLLGSTLATDQDRLAKVLTEAVKPLSIDVARRRIPVPGENPIKQKMIFALRIFVSSEQKNELATKLISLYPFDGEQRGLDGKSCIFVPDSSFYASTISVKNYEKLRDRQEKLERRLRTEIIADLKAAHLDTELDDAGNTMRKFLQSLLGPGSSKEKYLLHNVDVHDNVVKFQCLPTHHQSVTTICSSLLTYMEHVLRNHRKGEVQEAFLKKLRKCFTNTAREFAASCRWNEQRQTMETPADKHMVHLMKAVDGRFAFDLSEMEAVPKSGIRSRQEDGSSMTTQASLGLDFNCFNGELWDKVGVVQDSIPVGTNEPLEGESQPKKPRPSEIVIVTQDSAGEILPQASVQDGTMDNTDTDDEGSRMLHMEKEMGKMREMMRLLQMEVERGRETVDVLQTEVQQGRDKMEEGKEREGKLQAEVHRLTLQLAGTDVTRGNSAGEQLVLSSEVPDVDMPTSEENETSVGEGNGAPDTFTAMDTGTPTKGSGGTA